MILDSRVIKFGMAGVINTLADWSVYFILSDFFHVTDIFAKIAGALAGITSAFLINSFWVFKDKFDFEFESRKSNKYTFVLSKYAQTLLAYSFGMAVNVVVFNFCIKMHLVKIFCLITATIFSFAVNYVLSKKIIYN